MLDTKVGSGDQDDPADVARDGFQALMDGDERVVSHSLKTKAQGIGSRVLPDSVKAECTARRPSPDRPEPQDRDQAGCEGGCARTATVATHGPSAAVLTVDRRPPLGRTGDLGRRRRVPGSMGLTWTCWRWFPLWGIPS